MGSDERPRPRARGRQVAERGRADSLATARAQPPRTEWHERAAFQVTFEYHDGSSNELCWRIGAHHEESDEQLYVDGLVDGELIGWMHDKAGLPAVASPVAEPTPAAHTMPPTTSQPEPTFVMAPTSEKGIRIEIDDLQIRVAEVLGAVGAQPKQYLEAQISLRVAGALSQHTLINQEPYLVTILAHNLEHAATLMLFVAHETFDPERSEYHLRANCALPEVGRYQLLATVLVPRAGAIECFNGPILEVQP